MATRSPTGQILARACARICDDKKATDIVLLDMRKMNLLTDYFLVCSVEAERQGKAIASEMKDHMEDRGGRVLGCGGLESGGWIVVDFGSVVCHILRKDLREFYDLEGLWQDAPRIAFRPPARRRAGPNRE